MSFDAKTELEQLQSQTQTIRKRSYTPSRLDRYTSELLELRQQGARISELQRWLKARRIKVYWSTVKRWLDKHG